jgi:DNA primase
MARIDWEALKARHSLASAARRTGLNVPDTGRVMVNCPKPGHDDSTPSMHLDLDKNRYRCYGCDAHGDVVQWVQDLEGVNVTDAVAILDSGRPITSALMGRSSGVAWAARTREGPDLERTQAGRVYAASAAAWNYYTEPAFHRAGADYLAGRGIDVSALEAELGRPVVGHTPNPRTGENSLVAHLRIEGFNDDELVDGGLATLRPNGSLVDLFWGRVILPITDDGDRIIGLLGRDINHRPAVKYVNPPRTHAYHKSAALYRPNIHQLHSHGNVVVCEGPLDALAIAAHAATAGRTAWYAPIAVCGRALTDTHIDSILALHPRAPVFAADGDTPGRQANLAWTIKALSRGRESVVMDWPEGQDPASWLADHGPQGLAAVTRRGCLEAPPSELRPRHCGAILTAATLDTLPPSGDKTAALDRIIAEVGRAGHRLGPGADQRYAAAAAELLGPVAVEIAIEATTKCLDFKSMIEHLGQHGARLPIAGQPTFAAGAAVAIERRDLAAAGWAERRVIAAIESAQDPRVPTDDMVSAAPFAGSGLGI